MSNYKSMAHSIREILEGKQVDPNQSDLDKLKKVAKVEDESDAEEKLDENQLEFGTDAARDKYSDDTPGQTPGVEHNEFQQGPKVALAVDGVPKPGGLIDKPKLGLKEAIQEVVNAADKKALEKLSKGLEGSVKAHAKQKKELDKAIDEDKVKNCGCGKDPCETYGSKEQQMKDVDEAAIKLKGFGKDAGPSNMSNPAARASLMKSKPDNVKVTKKKKAPVNEEGRWDETDDGKAYRAMSPEEKHQHRLKKEVMRKSKELKGDKKYAKEGYKQDFKRREMEHELGHEVKRKTSKPKMSMAGITSAGDKKVVTNPLRKEEAIVDMLNDMIDRYQLDEASVISKSSSSAEKKMAANKIFRMHQAKQAAKATPKNDAGARAAKRDSAGYKTSDDSHLYKKPSKPEPKRGRGERDLPHIATQLRGVVDMGAKHSGVKFKDGTTKSVSPDHAKSWLKKHDSSKPQERLSMYKSHDSHSEFMKHK